MTAEEEKFNFQENCYSLYSEIKERGSVPPRPEKTHKTVPKSAESYKCILY